MTGVWAGLLTGTLLTVAACGWFVYLVLRARRTPMRCDWSAVWLRYLPRGLRWRVARCFIRRMR